MRSLRLLYLGLTVVFAVFQWFAIATAAPLDDLIAAARKEGTLDFYGPSTLKAEGAQAIAQAFNKKYATNIDVKFIPSGSMTRDVGKVATQAATGGAPEWDVMVATDAHHASLWLRKLHKPFDYKSLGVDEKLIDHDGGAISFVHQYIVPAYNSSMVSPKDAPKSWEDLLQPKWKGKVGVSTATHHLGRLAVGPWGEEKTTAYVKALAEQNPVVGELGPTFTRLQLGEILVALSLTDSYIHTAKQTGAPVAEAIEVQPGRLSVAIMGSFEKTSQGYLDQHFEGALFEYALVAGGLKMKLTTQSTSHFGDKETIVGGTPTAAVAEGLLQKVR